MINNRIPIRQTIHEKVVLPSTEAKLQPDSGIAYLSKGYYRGRPGTDPVRENWWDGIRRVIGDVIDAILQVDGLDGDEIVVDVVVRTPNGNKVIPNIPLHSNFLSGTHGSEAKRRLRAGQPLYVKLTYDGGKPSEAAIIAWKFDAGTPDDAKIQHDGKTPESRTAPELSQPESQLTGTGFGIPSSPEVAAALNVSEAHPVAFWISWINEAAQRFAIDPCFIGAIMTNESAGNPRASSPTGAMGLMQIEPDTYAECWKAIKGQVTIKIDAMDPYSNIMCGSYYLKQMLDGVGGNYKLAAASYNAGPNAVKKYGGVPPFVETQNYVKVVMKTYGELKNSSAFHATSVIGRSPAVKNQDTSLTFLNTGSSIGASSK
jgi:hypothetical protein